MCLKKIFLAVPFGRRYSFLVDGNTGSLVGVNLVGMGAEVGEDALQHAMHGGEIVVRDVAEGDGLQVQQEGAETGFERAARRGQVQADDAAILWGADAADQFAAFQFVYQRRHGRTLQAAAFAEFRHGEAILIAEMQNQRRSAGEQVDVFLAQTEQELMPERLLHRLEGAVQGRVPQSGTRHSRLDFATGFRQGQRDLLRRF